MNVARIIALFFVLYVGARPTLLLGCFADKPGICLFHYFIYFVNILFTNVCYNIKLYNYMVVVFITYMVYRQPKTKPTKPKGY